MNPWYTLAAHAAACLFIAPLAPMPACDAPHLLAQLQRAAGVERWDNRVEDFADGAVAESGAGYAIRSRRPAAKVVGVYVCPSDKGSFDLPLL